MPKKILIIIGTFLISGGLERAASKLGSKLCDKGYDIYYLNFFKTSPNYKIKGKIFSLNQHYYDLNKAKSFKKLLKNINYVIKSWFFVYPKKIRDFSNKYNIDLIITFGEYNNLPALLSRVLFKNKSKIIISVHTNPDLAYAKSGDIFNLINYFIFNVFTIRLLYRKADKIVTISKGIEKVLYNYGYCKDNVKTIYNFIDIDLCLKLSKEKIPFEFREIFRNNFVFVNVGRLAPVKAHMQLIRCFKKVVTKYNKAKLVIIGDGILKNDLKELINKLNLEKDVYLIGEYLNIFPFLKRSNCLVFTSFWEGFGRVILEALSMNLPVISTDCNYGPREILCPEFDLFEKIYYPYYAKYGILIKTFRYGKKINNSTLSYQEKVLANVMIKIIEDPKIQNKYSNGLIRARDFDEKIIIQHWEKLIDPLIT